LSARRNNAKKSWRVILSAAREKASNFNQPPYRRLIAENMLPVLKIQAGPTGLDVQMYRMGNVNLATHNPFWTCFWGLPDAE
jgi:hypothetical protein